MTLNKSMTAVGFLLGHQILIRTEKSSAFADVI